jgi:hypothetical protein
MPSTIFPEPIVGSLRFNHPLNLFQPTDATVLLVVEFRNIGFDIQERCAIQDVHVLDVQGGPLDPDESHNGKPDGIGPLRCSCGENASRFRIKERGNDQLVTAALMEVVKKDEMGEAVKVLQPFSKFRKQLHGPVNSCCA